MFEKLSAEQIKAYKEAGMLDDVIATMKEIGAKNDVSANLPYANPVYGMLPGSSTQSGIFTRPGVRPETISAIGQPMDFTSVLNPVSSQFAQERVGILTGQTATEGTNPSDVCGTPARPGQLKTCQQNYVFGQLYIGSEKLSITSAGMLANRAVSERTILNAAQTDPLIPDVLQAAGANLLSPEAQALYQLGTAVRRVLSVVAITGDPSVAYGSAELGFVREFNGLDTLIKTGYADAITSAACPAADSDVRTWGAATSATVGGNSIAQELTDLYFGRVTIARQVGIDAQWAFVMPFPLFRELTYDYASNYFVNRLTAPFTSSVTSNTNSESTRRLQIEMLNGNYLLIDNVAVPVLFSDGQPAEYAGNYHQSDIYLIPVSINGRDGVRFEFFPMDNPQAAQLINRFNNEIQVLNGGMYAMAYERSKFCVEMVLTAQFRMFLEAPFLAGRLDSVQYTSNIKYRSPLPGGASYVNGGVTYVTGVNS